MTEECYLLLLLGSTSMLVCSVVTELGPGVLFLLCQLALSDVLRVVVGPQEERGLLAGSVVHSPWAPTPCGFSTAQGTPEPALAYKSDVNGAPNFYLISGKSKQLLTGGFTHTYTQTCTYTPLHLPLGKLVPLGFGPATGSKAEWCSHGPACASSLPQASPSPVIARSPAFALHRAVLRFLKLHVQVWPQDPDSVGLGWGPGTCLSSSRRGCSETHPPEVRMVEGAGYP